jgi:hypothetical protein
VLRELDSVHFRHANVEQDHVGGSFGEHVERAARGPGLPHELELHVD